jgi:hypothetical protein
MPSLAALLERYKALRAHELELNRATAEFERAVLQPLFLLNGGASVAVLGLLGAVSERITKEGIQQVDMGLYFWAIGLVSPGRSSAPVRPSSQCSACSSKSSPAT